MIGTIAFCLLTLAVLIIHWRVNRMARETAKFIAAMVEWMMMDEMFQQLTPEQQIELKASLLNLQRMVK